MRDFNFISVTPSAWVAIAVMLLVIPLPWSVAWLTAAVTHELFHCLAVYCCAEKILQIEIGIHGANIETGFLPDGKRILCILAGPVGGLLLILFAELFPQLAICGFLQSAFNLLPIYPLDGGRAVRIGLDLISKRMKHRKIPCK